MYKYLVIQIQCSRWIKKKFLYSMVLDESTTYRWPALSKDKSSRKRKLFGSTVHLPYPPTTITTFFCTFDPTNHSIITMYLQYKYYPQWSTTIPIRSNSIGPKSLLDRIHQQQWQLCQHLPSTLRQHASSLYLIHILNHRLQYKYYLGIEDLGYVHASENHHLLLFTPRSTPPFHCRISFDIESET